MSIERQHAQFVSDIRRGRAHARDLVGRYDPFTTSFGCVKHMVIDDDGCPDCARRARERDEDRQVDRYREELWEEQRDYDAEVKREQQAQEKKERQRADREAALAQAHDDPEPEPSRVKSAPRKPATTPTRRLIQQDRRPAGYGRLAAFVGVVFAFYLVTKVAGLMAGLS